MATSPSPSDRTASSAPERHSAPTFWTRFRWSLIRSSGLRRRRCRPKLPRTPGPVQFIWSLGQRRPQIHLSTSGSGREADGCAQCLATSRTAIPRQIFNCPGLAANLRNLMLNPRGHKLHVATFTSGAGMVVICSRCGHFATSNRKVKLHTEKRPSTGPQEAFQSDGARAAYRRVGEGKHPAYKHGDAKVLDPCISAETLLQLGTASQETFPT